MANTLGVYNPIFYANQALIWLSKSLGLASRVYMGYDEERRTFNKGDTINIRRPATFTAQNAPSSAQDLGTETVSMTLDQWKEVKFSLTDKELAYSGDRIITDHIAPAAYALADNIDQALCALHYKIPEFTTTGSAATTAKILTTRKNLFELKCPLADAANMHYMLGGVEEASILADTVFGVARADGAGAAGAETQLSGHIGRRFGFEFFANQNRPLTAGAYTNVTDTAGALVGAHTKGATSLSIDGLATAEAYEKGWKIAIGSYIYATTADVTTSGGAGTFTISPPLQADAADNAVVTFSTAFDAMAQQNVNIAFHKNAFGLAMARLPDYSEMFGNDLGVRMASVQDPVTGLAVRARIFAVPDSSKVQVALDTLYGVQILDPYLACRDFVAT